MSNYLPKTMDEWMRRTESDIARLMRRRPSLPSGPSMVGALLARDRPIIVGHRGAARIYPEHTMAGYRACMEYGYAIEVDIRTLASGELVCIHDATTGRTMTGPDSTVSGMTISDWRSRQVISPWRGGSTEPPAVWEEVLEQFGGRTAILAEVKSSNVTDVISSVQRRGLGSSVIIQSFTFAEAQQAAQAGVFAMFLCGATIGARTPQDIVDAGIQFVGPSLAMTDADIAALQAVGLIVIPYTVNTVQEFQEVTSSGADGAFCDDPWGNSGRQPTATRDPFSLSRPFYGWKYKSTSGDTSYQGINYLSSQNALFLDGNPITGTIAMRQGWAAPQTVTTGTVLRLRFTLGMDVNATADSRWAGVFLGTTPFDDAYDDNAAGVAGQFGYHFLIRRDGRLNIYEVTASGGPTLLNGLATTQMGFADQFHAYPIEILVGNNLVLRRLDTGAAASSGDATVRSNLSLHFTANQGVFTVSDVSYALIDSATLTLV